MLNVSIKNVERIYVIKNYSKVYDMFYSMFNKCIFTNYHIYCYFRLNVIWLWWHMNHILPREGCRFVNTKSLRHPDSFVSHVMQKYQDILYSHFASLLRVYKDLNNVHWKV